jgi:hypothetical protein
VRTSEGREAPDFTIELAASDGTTVTAPVSRFADVPPVLQEKFTKLDFVERDRYGNNWEPVFQTVRAPLSAFASVDGRMLDPQKLVAVRVRLSHGDECHLHQRNRLWIGVTSSPF